MCRKRPRLVLGVWIAVVCCLFAGCSGSSQDGGKATAPDPGRVEANFDKVKAGMSEAQVAELIGPPAENWDVSGKAQEEAMKRYQLVDIPRRDRIGDYRPTMREKTWKANDRTFSLLFENSQVIGKISPEEDRTAGSSAAANTAGTPDDSAKSGPAIIDQTPVD
jgi:hypothetical protein